MTCVDADYEMDIGRVLQQFFFKKLSIHGLIVSKQNTHIFWWCCAECVGVNCSKTLYMGYILCVYVTNGGGNLGCLVVEMILICGSKFLVRRHKLRRLAFNLC